DNTNFYNTICSWTGGDLIYKGSGLSTTAANNKIKVGDKACTTSGQGYISNSAAGDSIPQVGCVLPNLAAGTHAVAISINGGSTYTINAGNVVYQENAKLSNCDTTSMQTFGADAAACKAAMQQGQVIVLNDPRGNSDNPNGQKYRVKKMPDGNVWMIDNLKLGSTTSTTALTPANTNITENYTLPAIDTTNNNADPGEKAYCSSTGLVHIHNPGNTTGCGYLYRWSVAAAETSSDSGYSISAKGWGLGPKVGTKSADELNDKMLAVAANSNSNRNPVYSISNYRNFGEGGTDNPAPWLGVYSGWHGFINNQFYHQGISGWYWSSTNDMPVTIDSAYVLHFDSSSLDTQSHEYKSYGRAVRSVL
ncbi:MAG: hypothetical protein LBT85_02845, partial [Bifidobacteriaceae bacterium]|nr:hypothetical protein [Bifidobacteriaceae bacterium]